MSFFVINIALPVPLQRTFDYLAKAGESRHHYQAGQRVRVEFGRQLLIGVVLGTREHTDIAHDKLRPILDRLDHTPVLSSESIALCHWLAHYYHHSLGEVFDHMLPAMLRRGCRLTDVDERVWQRQVDANQVADVLLKGAKQQQLWQLFAQQDRFRHSDLTQAGFSLAQCRKLAQLGLIAERQTLPAPLRAVADPTVHTLNSEQQHAVDTLRSQLGQFHPCLLEGITGSGKTEVYLRVIEAALQRQQQVLVLVPEIGLTPQTAQRFRARFDVPVTLLHSGLNDRERLQGWRQAGEGLARIVIGTRSAVFTPMPDLGLIIIDEEHDSSFKQQDGLRYSARDFALVRAQKRAIPVVLGSATPSLETLHNALSGRYTHIKLTQRAGLAKPPAMTLHSILHQPLIHGFAKPILAKMQQHLSQGKQVLVFLNRRGFAPLMACRHCGWMAECNHCDARMTLHQFPPHLHCHHCDFQQAIPSQCPQCGSHEIDPIGQGTERVVQHLTELFPEDTIHRVDRDSVRNKDAFDTLFHTIHNEGPCILVGTQMLAKGHHFPDVTLVVVLDADAGLFSSDFRGMEHTAQLIHQVAGRAGRAENPGEVWIQTLYADHPQLNTLLTHGYHALALELLRERQQQQLPPFSRMALLRSECDDRTLAQQLLHDSRSHLQQWLQQQGHGARINLLGPFPAIMERRAGRYRHQLQLYANDRPSLHQSAEVLVRFLATHPTSRKVRWHIDIDPIDTL
ncbi:MAG: primosomal protein N' [Bacterioplanes sp.]|nr:primosomal protein N' [Bacterioplanes sp.]